EDGDYTIEGDRDHLSNIMFNLLDNALKYSGEKAVIKVHLRDDKTKVVFAIEDNGIGIKKEYQSKVFEKFFRVPTGDLHSVKGHGLGLSYVKQVVKSHRGEVQLESKPEHGSTFKVSLPKTYGKK
ncbi:MAG: ATP-binding protein, partial [Cyclobacteriaceae bacterium]